MQRSKWFSVTVLVIAELAAMSLWFTSAAILPDMVREVAISPFRQALLSSGVQGGFVIGALFYSISGIPDRFDPRRVFAISALLAAAANASLVVSVPGSASAIAARIATGALIAGVYPVGMKIAVGWGTRDRGLLVGLLVGALTFGNSVPFLAAWLGGAEWRTAVLAVSLFASIGALLALAVGLGPSHARATRFEPGAIRIAWTDRRVRAAYLGYFGHMWELFAFWAWIGVAASVSYAATMGEVRAAELARLTSFVAIAGGALSSVLSGAIADRIGKAEVAILAMAASGTCALLTAVSFSGPVWLVFGLIILWGITVIPDSAQFSALVADFSPPHHAGSLMTFQTALGFALTAVTVQIVPLAAGWLGWPAVLAAMALGPAFGIVSMLPVRRARLPIANVPRGGYDSP